MVELFVMMLLNVLVDCGLKISPVVFGLSVAAFHTYVEVMSLVKGILAVPLLQILAVVALVIFGAGFTVNVKTCVPAQPPTTAVGVIVYVTV